MPTNQDDDHAKYHSLKGACVGVGWKRGLGAICQTREYRSLFLSCKSLYIAFATFGKWHEETIDVNRELMSCVRALCS